MIAETQIQAFLELEKREPGLWALAQGENSLLIKNRLLEEGRGALVELTRAIPVPDKDVPLNDILEFRLKRRDDLLRLRHEIDSLFTAVNDAADKQFELRRRIAQIDTACADILKIAKESALRFRLSDFKASFEIKPISAIAALVGWQVGVAHEMPIVSAAIAGAAASFKIKKDFGVHGIKLRASPYRYVYHFHNDIF